MFKDKEIRKGIISSIIASVIFLILFQPLIQLFWDVLTKVSKNTYSGYLDRVYKNAALGQRNWIDFITLFMILYAFILYLITLSLRLRLKLTDLKRAAKFKNITTEEEKRTYIGKEKLRTNKRVTFLLKNSKIISSFTYLGQIVVIVLIVDTIFRAYIDLQLNASFNQRVTVISPYIDIQQEKILKSQWAQMESRKDYEEVNSLLEELAKNKNVKLPQPLLR